jgi:hypothetical protein
LFTICSDGGSPIEGGEARGRWAWLGKLERNLRNGILVAGLFAVRLHLGLRLNGLDDKRRGNHLDGIRDWLRLWSVHTCVRAPIKAAQPVVWAICVPLSRAPAVADSASTISSSRGSRALSGVRIGATSRAAKGTLSCSVETCRCVTVHIEPPVTDKDLLVEDGAVGTEERDGVEVQVGVLKADVVGLAVLLWICIVAAHHKAVAGETRLLYGSEDRIVDARLARDCVPQPVKGVATVGLARSKQDKTQLDTKKDSQACHRPLSRFPLKQNLL